MGTLIQVGARRSTGMSEQAVAALNVRPLFAVSTPAHATKSVDEHVKALGVLAHVVEVQATAKSGSTYALVHASPVGVARIATELSLEVYRSKRGEDYYAVCVARSGAQVPAQVSTVQARPVATPQGLVQRIARPAPSGAVKLTIRGNDYIVTETRTIRSMDARRWTVGKDGEMVDKPYVVTFQDSEGREAQCSCPDWIYRRHQCKHIKGIQAAFGGARQTSLANVG